MMSKAILTICLILTSFSISEGCWCWHRKAKNAVSPAHVSTCITVLETRPASPATTPPPVILDVLVPVRAKDGDGVVRVPAPVHAFMAWREKF